MNYHISVVMNCLGGRPWRNGFHFVMPDAPTLPDPTVNAAALKIVDLLKSLELTQVNFVSATVSKVRAPGTAKTAADFVTIPLSGTGTIVAPAEDHSLLPKELCMKMSLIPTAGRNGSVLLRMSLGGGWWQNISGEATLTNAPRNNFTAVTLPLFHAAGFPQLVLLDKHAGPDTVGRNVTDLSLAGIVARQETVKRKKKATNTKQGLIAYAGEAVAALVGVTQGIAWLKSKFPNVTLPEVGPALADTIAEMEAIIAAAGTVGL